MSCGSCIGCVQHQQHFLHLLPPEGRLGMSDVSPLSGVLSLSFDSTLLSPLLFYCLVLLLFLSYLFCLLVHSSELFPENSSIFCCKRQAFLYDSCLAARRSMCSMLPHGTGIMLLCIYIIFKILLLLSIPFFILFKNLILINGGNGLLYQCVLALCAFLTRVIQKGLIFPKKFV